ncbi:MAG: FeoA family protein [Pyrinomonadaceae bacterium]
MWSISATVTGIRSENADRRRMLDLGILPGAKVENVMSSPLGDPVAYRVRGALVALRREQAALIEVTATHSAEENSGKL